MKAKIKNRFHQLEVAMRQNQTDINNLARLMEMNRQAIIKLENEGEQPKTKTLDQSVFDGLDEKWQFAAVDKNSEAHLYTHRMTTDGAEFTFCEVLDFEHELIGEGYDTTNWQDSLIERDIAKDLTGSDLCRAMLDKGFEYVMCLVGDECEESASNSEVVRVVCSHGADYFDDTTEDMWYFAIPINNQGEPLTASEVGL